MNSRPNLRLALLLAIPVLLTGACASDSRDPISDQKPEPSRIIISEVLAGGSENNNLEFIELYNNGGELIDLKHWSLVYRLATSEEDLIVLTWEDSALIPPFGYFLLVREGQDFGLSPDGYFEQSLNTSGGGLSLINADGERMDAVAWGKAPAAFTEGSPAPSLEDNQSLDRKAAEAGGNRLDLDDNLTDFRLNPSPEPQNVTHRALTQTDGTVQLIVDGPLQAQPGSQIEYTVTVRNLGDKTLNDLTVEIPLPENLEQIRLPVDWLRDNFTVQWRLNPLAPGEVRSGLIEAQAPWIYGTITIQNALGRQQNSGSISLAAALRTEVSGGVIPINIARTLMDQIVLVEGTATMYTDGFFAGSSGTKFYIDDGTAGVQVYVPGGMGLVNVPIGAQVRVEGEAQLYRGAVEMVPATPDLVEVLDRTGSVDPTPEQVSIRQAANDLETLPGKLIEVQGTIVRAQEFSFSYELDIVDDEGQRITGYLDKLTNATIEAIDVGETYRVQGILEVLDGTSLIYPRQAGDLTRIYQPIIYLDAEAPSAVDYGADFTITLSAENHTDQTLNNVILWADKPGSDVALLEIRDSGAVEGQRLVWAIPELPGAGGRVEVQYRLRMQAGTESYTLAAAGLETKTDLQSSEISPVRVFHGGIVPIWAIQGEGPQSPYRLDQVTTTGVVTGVFPELNGFWLQDTVPDKDPSTSEGLFIFHEQLEPQLSQGDFIRIRGQVREISAQTQLRLDSLDQLQLLASGTSLPDAIPLDPPAALEAAAVYFEALEGMLVQVAQPAVVVGPSSRYGETFLILSKHGIARVLQGEETGLMIVVDDGSEAVHYDQSTMSVALAVGDQLDRVYGPLAYTFGAFKIEPLEPPAITRIDHPLPSIEQVPSHALSVMTWNVENLFDILEPHPSDPPRPRRAEYELALTKIAATIVSAGAPTVIGLQEVENLSVLEDLADQTMLESFNYTAILLEGTDSRGIDVGYLVRSDQAEILNYAQYPAPEGLTSRPPLMLHVKLIVPEPRSELYMLNNHFTSMSGGVEATEPRRNEQALWNVQILQEIQRQDPGANIIVMGDLNSFEDSLPIETLRRAGLRHVFEIDPDQIWYSYVYQGTTQTLDHMLVTPSLFDMLVETVALHTNADFPPSPPDDPSPMHISDHDPVIAFFSP